MVNFAVSLAKLALSILFAAASFIDATVDVILPLAKAAVVAPLICPCTFPKVVSKVLAVEVAFEAAVTEAIELIPPIVIES